MRFCQRHWDRLRAAIDERGLTPFIAKDGGQAMSNMLTELQGGEHVFDPLMGAHWAIANNAMAGTPAGLSLLQPNEDGTPRCPLCYINGERHRHAQEDPANFERADDTEFYSEWIERAADDQREKAIKLGKIPSV